MPETVGGPRDHLANERTQLAWLRTGANIMVVGLVVARFGEQGEVSTASLAAGAVLVLVGAGTIVYGTLRYRRVARELREGSAAAAASSAGPSIAAGVVIAAVVVAATILIASSGGRG